MIDESLARTLCLLSLNYLLLSTLFISVIWCLCKSRHLKSDSLRDQLWKLSLIAPVVLMLVQAAWQPSTSTWNLAKYLEREQFVTVTESPASIVPDPTKKYPAITFAEKFSPIKKIASEFQAFPESIAVPVDSFLPLEAAPLIEEPVENSTETTATIIFPEAEQTISGEPNVAKTEEVLIVQAAVESNSTTTPKHQNETPQQEAQLKTVPVRPLKLWDIVASLIGVSVLLGGMRVVLQSFIIFWEIRGFKIVETGLAKEILIDLQRRLPCPFHIQLLESSQKIEPAACGIWRKKILIPANLTEQLSSEEVEALLAHEVAHLLRRDPLWAWSLYFIRSCFFWQPFNFLAVRNWRMAAELCCDSNAVAAGVDRFNLARCLTRVATWKLTTRPTLGVGASTATLGMRVERLVEASLERDEWRDGWRRGFRWGIALVLLPLVFCFAPRMSWELEASQADSSVVNGFTALADDSDRAFEFAQPLPVEETNSPGNPFSNEPVVAEQSESPLSLEIQQLTTDLNYALELLSEQERDPEILAGIKAIQAKLKRLNERAAEIDMSGTSRSPAGMQE